ncbi:MAG: adenosylmethionine decarboxylase [Alphaproteobacteria bacterium]
MVVSSGQERPHATPVKAANAAVDYFIEKDGLAYAGLHVLLDFWGCKNLDDLEVIEGALRAAVAAAGATLLDINLHHFTTSGGVSGVAVLAESHISIHTWPERSYAALDIFMCGNCDPYKAIPILREAFQPTAVQLHEQRRGLTI